MPDIEKRHVCPCQFKTLRETPAFWQSLRFDSRVDYDVEILEYRTCMNCTATHSIEVKS